ncbi:MAG: hypothetical protein Q8O93_01085 [bacterium]|nr:hypothetical protein [bacterium]
MDKVIDEKVFSESKGAVNRSLLAVAGLVLFMAAYVVFLIALSISALLIAAAHYLEPLKLIIFEADLSATLPWLVSRQWLIFFITFAAYFYCWLYAHEANKEKNEKR